MENHKRLLAKSSRNMSFSIAMSSYVADRIRPWSGACFWCGSCRTVPGAMMCKGSGKSNWIGAFVHIYCVLFLLSMWYISYIFWSAKTEINGMITPSGHLLFTQNEFMRHWAPKFRARPMRSWGKSWCTDFGTLDDARQFISLVTSLLYFPLLFSWPLACSFPFDSTLLCSS